MARIRSASIRLRMVAVTALLGALAAPPLDVPVLAQRAGPVTHAPFAAKPRPPEPPKPEPKTGPKEEARDRLDFRELEPSTAVALFGPLVSVDGRYYYRYRGTVLIPKESASLALRRALDDDAQPIITDFLDPDTKGYDQLRGFAGPSHQPLPKTVDELDAFFANYRGSLLLVVAHNEAGVLVMERPDVPAEAWPRLPLDKVREFAHRHNVILQLLACEAGRDAVTDGPGGNLWLPQIVARLKKTTTKARTLGDVLAALGSESEPWRLNSAEVNAAFMSFRFTATLAREIAMEFQYFVSIQPGQQTIPPSQPGNETNRPFSGIGDTLNFVLGSVVFIVLQLFLASLLIVVIVAPFALLDTLLKKVFGPKQPAEEQPQTNATDGIAMSKGDHALMTSLIAGKREPWASELKAVLTMHEKQILEAEVLAEKLMEVLARARRSGETVPWTVHPDGAIEMGIR